MCEGVFSYDTTIRSFLKKNQIATHQLLSGFDFRNKARGSRNLFSRLQIQVVVAVPNETSL